MATNKRVTARDVAALAGVSPGTVSKALSGNGAVHPDTRERILEAARELGLRSPQIERSDPDRHLTVGLVTWEPFSMRRTAPVLLGAMDKLAENDIAFLLCDGRGDRIRERHFVDTLIKRKVDGIFVAGSGRAESTRPPLRGAIDVPVVYTMTASTGPEDVSVVPDDYGGAELAARHLVSTGRRRIACILGPRRVEASNTKIVAVGEVLAEHGLELAAEPFHGPWDGPRGEQWGRQAAMHLVHNGVDADGLVCGNDMIARGAASALASMGRSVPDDTAVIGFDNWTSLVEGNRPQLSSIDLNLTKVGVVAATKMIEAIHFGTHTPGVTTIECELVPRESTAVTAETVPPVQST